MYDLCDFRKPMKPEQSTVLLDDVRGLVVTVDGKILKYEEDDDVLFPIVRRYVRYTSKKSRATLEQQKMDAEAQYAAIQGSAYNSYVGGTLGAAGGAMSKLLGGRVLCGRDWIK